MADDNARPPLATTSSTTTTTYGPTTTTSTTSFTAAGSHTTVTTSGPQSTTVVSPTVVTTYQIPASRPPPSSNAAPIAAAPPEYPPSIRIQRNRHEQAPPAPPVDSSGAAGRRRSSSEPQRPTWASLQQDGPDLQRQLTATPLQTLTEEGPGVASPQFASINPSAPARTLQRPGWGRQRSAISLRTRARDQERRQDAPQYNDHVVDMLDCIDPEVATLTTLNNVQNSLFIPNLGWLYNRQPTYNLTQTSPETSSDEEANVGTGLPEQVEKEVVVEGPESRERPDLDRINTISSVLSGVSETHNYAVLPHGVSLPGWTEEEKAALNDHVRHLLHSRRARFKRSMRGFGRYVRKPIGFLVTLYAFLLTFWGAAWVLFLIGWIYVGDRQAYFIEICDQILTALFCVVGIGFAPWRAVDTYHMIFVARYAHLTWKLRKARGLPKLRDRNELPTQSSTPAWERGLDTDPNSEEIVLTPAQQRSLEHHQSKLASSHTFYKPHETNTHRAFSVRLLIAIVVLLDFHSLFQMALGGTTWGIYYKDRHKAITAVILSCSISCNISAGVTIGIGDRRSRKKVVVEQMFRQNVTEEVLVKLKKEKGLKVKGLNKGKAKGKKGKGEGTSSS